MVCTTNPTVIRRSTFTYFLNTLLLVISSHVFSQEQPNILWIVADDWGQDAGCYGTKAISTPNIDKLASEGIMFNHAYANAPVCSPSRSSFITGAYPATIRSLAHRPVTKQQLPDSIHTLMYYLRQAGYYCTNKGKTDYNFKKKETRFDGNNWKDRASGQPFFSQIQIYDPHRKFTSDPSNPVDPQKIELHPKYPDHPIIRKDWALYHEAIQSLDKKVGAILQRLEDEGLADNTIVFLFGDHGRPHLWDKQWLYEDGIRTPMIVRWPGQITPGSVSDKIIDLLDLAPTVLSIANQDIPSYMPGQSFIQNESRTKNYSIGMRDRSGDAVDQIRSIRTKDYSLIVNLTPEKPYTQHSSYKRMFYPAFTMVNILDKAGELTPEQAFFYARHQT